MKIANSMISLVIGLVLLLAGAYAAYCLWDNRQIYAAADNVQAELLALKPKAETAEAGPTFDDLLAINPDVCAWISMDGTKIDHPVLQGESNMDYINTDVYGNFALAGSIFLDSRNATDFSDPYSLLYGHHMEKSAMFGDLDKYLDRDFFYANSTGALLLPDRCCSLQVIACIQTKASEDRIFEPSTWTGDMLGLLDYAQDESIFLHSEILKALRSKIDAGTPVQIVALTTCSSAFTDARTIVLTEMNEYPREEGGELAP